jgi:hypothetical protein
MSSTGRARILRIDYHTPSSQPHTFLALRTDLKSTCRLLDRWTQDLGKAARAQKVARSPRPPRDSVPGTISGAIFNCSHSKDRSKLTYFSTTNRTSPIPLPSRPTRCENMSAFLLFSPHFSPGSPQCRSRTKGCRDTRSPGDPLPRGLPPGAPLHPGRLPALRLPHGARHHWRQHLHGVPDCERVDSRLSTRERARPGWSGLTTS